jgi:NTP pyrophosphatase (non-canonical NTP hydrolase)
MDRLSALIETINSFVREREWTQYHSAKNLAASISIEANELLEHYQWAGTDDEIRDPKKIEAIGDEIADVFVYLLDLCGKYDFDIIELAEKKIEKNKRKYPVNQCKGSSKKYTSYELPKNEE